MGMLLEWASGVINSRHLWNGHLARYNSQNEKAKNKGEPFGGALPGYWLRRYQYFRADSPNW